MRIKTLFLYFTFFSLLVILFSSCKPKISFTGEVWSSDKKSISGATVKVNGASTTTSENGKFSIRVNMDKSYLVTVKKPGFSLYSKLHNAGLKERRIVLEPAKTKDFDPSMPIDLQDDIARPRPKITFNNSTNPLSSVPKVYNAAGELVGFGWPTSMKKEIDDFNSVNSPVNGFRVRIPANGLAASGNVTVAVTTINIFDPSAMPGDYSARFNEQYGYMLSYGAGVVDAYQGSKSVNLTKGEKATISLPIDSSFIILKQAIPDSIPFLTFDEETGTWIQEGWGKFDKRTNTYSAQTTHFSAFNFDVLKTNPSCAAFDFNKTSFTTPDPPNGYDNPLARAVVEVYSSPSYHPQFGACFDVAGATYPCPGSAYAPGDFKSSDCGTRDSLFAIKNIPNNTPLAFVVKTISEEPNAVNVDLFATYTVVNNVAVIYTGGPASGLGPNNEPICDYTSHPCVKPPTFVRSSPAASPQLEIAGCATPAGANYDIRLFWIFKYTNPADADNLMQIYQRGPGGDCGDDLSDPPTLAQWTDISAGILNPDSFVYYLELAGFSGPPQQFFKVRIVDGDPANIKEVCLEMNLSGAAVCVSDLFP